MKQLLSLNQASQLCLITALLYVPTLYAPLWFQIFTAVIFVALLVWKREDFVIRYGSIAALLITFLNIVWQSYLWTQVINALDESNFSQWTTQAYSILNNSMPSLLEGVCVFILTAIPFSLLAIRAHREGDKATRNIAILLPLFLSISATATFLIAMPLFFVTAGNETKESPLRISAYCASALLSVSALLQIINVVSSYIIYYGFHDVEIIVVLLGFASAVLFYIIFFKETKYSMKQVCIPAIVASCLMIPTFIYGDYMKSAAFIKMLSLFAFAYSFYSLHNVLKK